MALITRTQRNKSNTVNLNFPLQVFSLSSIEGLRFCRPWLRGAKTVRCAMLSLFTCGLALHMVLEARANFFLSKLCMLQNALLVLSGEPEKSSHF